MKLAQVKIEYSSGTTIVDRVSIDPLTGRVYLAPRVLGLMETMEQSECSPSFSLQYKGFVLPVAAASGEYRGGAGNSDSSVSGKSWGPSRP